MELLFKGNLQLLNDGINFMSEELGFEICQQGLSIDVNRCDTGLRVIFNGVSAQICYSQTVHFFRGLGLLIEKIKEQKAFEIHENTIFDTCGLMLDCSRNAVPKVDTLKTLLKKMALMGLNMLMLYTEDTYTIEGEPYFGYMRGRYLKEELETVDRYAEKLGIEIIPCIQTLGHLYHLLKWDTYQHLRDTGDCLLAESEETYAFIEKMIKAASSPFRSKRIHVGLDEAFGLGMGRHYAMHGPPDKLKLMVQHVRRVCEIAENYGLKPMMWGDMFFWEGTPGRNYLDSRLEMTEEQLREYPQNMQCVYWNYFARDRQFHEQMIEAHRKFSSQVAYAGGLVAWSGFAPKYSLMYNTIPNAMAACKAKGVKDVFLTFWGDDGNQCDVLSCLLGLQLFAETCYGDNTWRETISSRVLTCTGVPMQSFLMLKDLDETPGVNANAYRPPCVSKNLLWQDPLLGLFDKDIEGIGLREHYAALACKVKNCDRGRMDFIFDLPGDLADVLELKAELGKDIIKYYKSKDLENMSHISKNIIPELIRRVERLRLTHRKHWFSMNKPFGWEILDLRYGGLLARLQSASGRINDYLEGRIDVIEELEEERLPFDSTLEGLGNGTMLPYARVVSVNLL